MENNKIIIEGNKRLKGEIKVSGSKNLALKIIPASILTRDVILLKNVPKIEDIKRSIDLIEDLGAKTKKTKTNLLIDSRNIKKIKIDKKFAEKFRASIIFVAPLLANFGEVIFPHPGGDIISSGGRPINLFIDGFKSLGAKVDFKNGYYHAKAKKLTGCDFFFPQISVTGTESMILAASLAEGITTLKNCALEPEIIALANYLNKQGAKIKGAGTNKIIIKGVKKLKPIKNFSIIPDRIEAGTFAIMAAATKSEVVINKCEPKHLEALLMIFKKIKINHEIGKNYIKIKSNNKIKSYSVKTHEYPGFVTDLQSPYTLLMTQAHGSSIIHETIYDRRLIFTDMLSHMGANIIMCDPHRIVVNGPTKLFGKKLTSPDIRAGITMIIAGLIASGTTEINNIYQINRGYENIVERLQSIGANISKK